MGARSASKRAREDCREFLSEFLAYCKQGSVAPSTYRDYRYYVDAHIVPLPGKVALRDLEPGQWIRSPAI